MTDGWCIFLFAVSQRWKAVGEAREPHKVYFYSRRCRASQGYRQQLNVGTTGYRGLQLDRKRRKELQEWKIALGHREDDHEDPANYPRQVY